MRCVVFLAQLECEFAPALTIAFLIATHMLFTFVPKVKKKPDGQRQLRGTEKYIFDNYSLVRGVAGLSVTRQCVLEFAFGRLGVTTAHVS